MKAFFRDLLASTLAILARAVIRKYKPQVVMVTGSVGKTSTKDAVTAVLNAKFYIWASKKNFNSEFGVPLTIFGMADRWSGLKDWVLVIGEAIVLILLPNHYPKILVLEVGADSPGDLARILRIATPDVVVVTRLPDVPVHVEAYATPGAVREEEFAPAYALAPGACLIVSADDQFARALAAPLSVELKTYGVSEDADVRIVSDSPLVKDGRVIGMNGVMHVSANGIAEEIQVPVIGTVGRPQMLAPAAAIAVGQAFGMSVEEIMKGVGEYRPPAGRGRLLAGKNNSCILDDSYNASPAAVQEALSSLHIIKNVQPHSRRIAALGDMLELGRYSQREHEAIGKAAAEKCDVLVAVGTRSRAMAEAATAAGMDSEAVHIFDSVKEAAVFLSGFVQEHDVILVKGSQSMRMERIAEALLADPYDKKLLVRQDAIWKRN